MVETTSGGLGRNGPGLPWYRMYMKGEGGTVGIFPCSGEKKGSGRTVCRLSFTSEQRKDDGGGRKENFVSYLILGMGKRENSGFLSGTKSGGFNLDPRRFEKT